MAENRQSYVDTKCLLLPLINKLTSIYRKEDVTIAEFQLLHTFPSFDKILPRIIKFSPKQVIEIMIKRHSDTKRKIEEGEIFLKCYCYNYLNSFQSEQNKTFKFSNNMPLAADIFTICYFSRIRLTNNKILCNIYKLMVEKYNIHDHEENPNEHITLIKIAYSFPSVSYPWFGYEPDPFDSQNFNLINTMINTFPGLHDKNILWCPMVASIIPSLRESKSFPPLLLLTAIIVKLNQILKDYFGDSYWDLSLRTIFQSICALHHSDVFPQSLKLMLCEKWGIVKKITDEKYEYADYFSSDEYKVRAINLIRKLKSQDPDLRSFLDRI